MKSALLPPNSVHVRWLMVAICCLAYLLAVNGKEPETDPTAMKSKEFTLWVSQTRSDRRNASQVKNALLKRLQSDRQVSDSSIMETTRALVEFSETETPESSRANAYEDIFAFFETLRPFLKDRPVLESWIYEKQGSLLNNIGSREKATDAFRSAVATANRNHIEADRLWISSLNSLGQLQVALSRRAEAEERFLEVMSYPWYNLTGDTETLKFFRNEYVKAAFGLIDCRRGNLNALKQITFVPATREELTPILKQALKEAGEK